MKYKFVLNALMPSLASAAAVASRGSSECAVEDVSSKEVRITGWSFGQSTSSPLDIPRRVPTAVISFMVTNSEWSQACSASNGEYEEGKWWDNGGIWFGCGSGSPLDPEPPCTKCTRFQFEWGHGSWRLTVNQTWFDESYRFVGTTTSTTPSCSYSSEAYYTSCTAPDFSLTLDPVCME
ncbi:uncharacterized protein F4822DRAFT_53696 [Hypoxylon trugodes]|uniref:uncharacterized protein n=1 Tax=Hypoxylon trugodes TaxID=326681 RepID=UPI0021A0DC60|nr:uncharacterized protein F4822DRAFT_53696 [Hypoxylon trugodes]KAI1383866.1 hypothetical protein F4822DRAFT_53696 [Hypoxylon trugodes]